MKLNTLLSLLLLTFASHLKKKKKKKKQEVVHPNQVSVAAMTSASDEKGNLSIVFSV